MALENKQSGQPFFAFELNNILKQVRQAVANLLAMNANNHWDYLSTQAVNISGTSASLQGTITMPKKAKFAVFQLTVDDAVYVDTKTELIIGREGITSASQKWTNFYTSSTTTYRDLNIAISGDTITLTLATGVSDAKSMVGNVYFYT